MPKNAIAYIMEFNEGFKWVAEIFFERVSRKYSPLILGKTFYKDCFKVADSLGKTMFRLGIEPENVQIVRVEGIATLQDYVKFITGWSRK